MRLLLVAALLMTPACLTECDGVGAIGSMRQGDMSHGAARGSMTPPVDGDDAPQETVEWTISPVFEFAAYLENSLADSDPVETPTCRGTLCSTLALTQGTLASRPLYRAQCPVGATTKPCFRLDGGDSVADSVARAELTFMHDGTGVTCAHVFETSAAAQHSPLHTGDTAGGAPGLSFFFASGQSYAQLQNDTAAVFIGTGAASTPVDQTHAIMWTDLLADTPDFAIFKQDFTTASSGGNQGTRSVAAPNNPLRWGGNWSGGNFLTGYQALIACWNQRLTTAQREAEQVNLETYFGGAFPL